MGEDRFQVRNFNLDTGGLIMMADAHLAQSQIAKGALGKLNLAQGFQADQRAVGDARGQASSGWLVPIRQP